MREIKFRAWQTQYKEMHQPLDGYIEFPDIVVGFSDGDLRLDKDDVILQQFTGLKDKNGKDIYEGDIVETNGIDGKLRWIFEYSEEDCGVYGGFSPESINHNFSSIHNNIDNCEVIGNIFENPELLN